MRHAREHSDFVALFIVADIVANASGCTGGIIHIVEPWDIQDDDLEAVAFECRLHGRRDHGGHLTGTRPRG